MLHPVFKKILINLSEAKFFCVTVPIAKKSEIVTETKRLRADFVNYFLLLLAAHKIYFSRQKKNLIQYDLILLGPGGDRLATPLHLFQNLVMKQSSHNNQIS